MKLTPELIELLKLTAEDVKLFNTPFAKLSKQGSARVFQIGDMISDHIIAEQDARRDEEKREREARMADGQGQGL